MTDQRILEQPIRGDALSQLIQTLARDIQLKLTASGRGLDDLRAIMVRCVNVEMAHQEIWKGVSLLFQMNETNTLPEPVKAQMASIVLAAKANMEIGARS